MSAMAVFGEAVSMRCLFSYPDICLPETEAQTLESGAEPPIFWQKCLCRLCTLNWPLGLICRICMKQSAVSCGSFCYAAANNLTFEGSFNLPDNISFPSFALVSLLLSPVSLLLRYVFATTALVGYGYLP